MMNHKENKNNLKQTNLYLKDNSAKKKIEILCVNALENVRFLCQILLVNKAFPSPLV